MRVWSEFLWLLLPCSIVKSLDNGVSKTPPMGWLDWERFRCNTDCDTDPENCISEKLFMKMADIMVSEGYKDAGYEYVAIDDCWLAEERTAQGRLQADPKRFPSGIKALADYVHSKGLKLGIYEDVGTKTCAGYPGSEGHFEIDAQTMADWGVDMVKFDGCHANKHIYDTGYPEFRDALNKTGRHMVYSCEWPMHEKKEGFKGNLAFYKKVANTCNVFRELADISDSWDSVYSQIDYFGADPGHFSQVAGPGAWNDADQLVIGNFGLSVDQQRVQMAMYSMLVTPLLMSNDLRAIPDESKEILLNKNVIAINQDPMGVQAKRIYNQKSLSIWIKPVLPSGSVAVAFLNALEKGGPMKVTRSMKDLELINPNGYNITELFENKNLGSYNATEFFTCTVNPTGVYLIKAVPLPLLNKKKRIEGQNDIL